ALPLCTAISLSFGVTSTGSLSAIRRSLLLVVDKADHQLGKAEDDSFGRRSTIHLPSQRSADLSSRRHFPGGASRSKDAKGAWRLVSAIRRVERDVLGDVVLPTIAVGQKSLLVVVKLLARFGGVFEVRTLDDGVDRTGLLAQPAIDAFDHIDVVARGAAGAVVPARTRLDGDGLRRTNRLAQLAGDQRSSSRSDSGAAR